MDKNNFKPNRILVVGDLHLKECYHNSESYFLDLEGKHISVLQKTFIDLLEVIQQFLLEKEKEGIIIDKLVFLGDIFDKPNITPKLLQFAVNYLDRFIACNEVDIISGNHDESTYGEYSAVFSLRDFVKRIKAYSRYVNSSDALTKGYVPYNVSAKESDKKTLFSHNFHHEVFENVPYEILPDTCKNVFAGHYHNNYTHKIGGSVIHYVGSPFPINKSEIHENRLLLLKEIEKDYYEIEEEIDTSHLLKWVSLDFSKSDFRDSIKELCKKYRNIMMEVFNADSEVMLQDTLKHFPNQIFAYKVIKKGFFQVPDLQKEIGVSLELETTVDLLVKENSPAKYWDELKKQLFEILGIVK